MGREKVKNNTEMARKRPGMAPEWPGKVGNGNGMAWKGPAKTPDSQGIEAARVVGYGWGGRVLGRLVGKGKVIV